MFYKKNFSYKKLVHPYFQTYICHWVRVKVKGLSECRQAFLFIVPVVVRTQWI